MANVRPTSVLKRKSIFSIIESYALKNSFELYNNHAVLDIFAGSGSIGLESLSRGMKKAYFQPYLVWRALGPLAQIKIII